jgi:hypothetical protein
VGTPGIKAKNVTQTFLSNAFQLSSVIGIEQRLPRHMPQIGIHCVIGDKFLYHKFFGTTYVSRDIYYVASPVNAGHDRRAEFIVNATGLYEIDAFGYVLHRSACATRQTVFGKIMLNIHSYEVDQSCINQVSYNVWLGPVRIQFRTKSHVFHPAHELFEIRLQSWFTSAHNDSFYAHSTRVQVAQNFTFRKRIAEQLWIN